MSSSDWEEECLWWGDLTQRGKGAEDSDSLQKETKKTKMGEPLIFANQH